MAYIGAFGFGAGGESHKIYYYNEDNGIVITFSISFETDLKEDISNHYYKELIENPEQPKLYQSMIGISKHLELVYYDNLAIAEAIDRIDVSPRFESDEKTQTIRDEEISQHSILKSEKDSNTSSNTPLYLLLGVLALVGIAYFALRNKK